MSIDIAKIEGFEGDFTAEEARNLFNETGEKRQYLCGICEIPIFQRNVEKEFSAEIFRVPHFYTPKGEHHFFPCDGMILCKDGMEHLKKSKDANEKLVEYPSLMVEAKPRVVTRSTMERVPLSSAEISKRRTSGVFDGERRRKRSYTTLIDFVAYYCNTISDHKEYDDSKGILEECFMTLLDGRRDSFSSVFRRSASTPLAHVQSSMWIFHERLMRVSMPVENVFQIQFSSRTRKTAEAGTPIFCEITFDRDPKGVDERLRRKLIEVVKNGPKKDQALYILGKISHKNGRIDIIPVGSRWCCEGDIPKPKSDASAVEAAKNAIASSFLPKQAGFNVVPSRA